MAEPVKLRFNCPNCHTSGEVNYPAGDILTSLLYTTAVWPNQQWKCPNCNRTYSTVLHDITIAGQTWAMREYKDPDSRIDVVPPGAIPPPPR